MSAFFDNRDWRLQRLGKFTASEIYKLMKGSRVKGELFGDVALMYINEKIAEIITGEHKENVDSRAMEWGRTYEPEAVEFYKQQTGIELEYFGGNNPKFISYNAFAGCSPDALSHDALEEFKCPYSSAIHAIFLLAQYESDHTAWLKKSNEKYYGQVQFGMICANKPLGRLVIYDPRAVDKRHKMAVLNIQPDEKYQTELKKRIEPAADIVRVALDKLYRPSVLLASYDPAGAVIIEKG